MLREEDKQYIESYISRKLTDVEIKAINKHLDKYNMITVCAWYEDWEDFCSDWCDEIGYSRTQARQLLHGGEGEFKTIDTIGILRFSI